MSEVPVIGSDIFATVLDIIGVPLPGNLTIDGVSMLPAFRGEDPERPIPMFWRKHVSPPGSHAAKRLGDWKIVAGRRFEKFQLYKIQEDRQEQNDLAQSMPKKLADMKQEFFKVWRGIEAEGPRAWWESEPRRK
ncbi:MAG: hypothetical protein ABGY71_00790 [bacterium]|nr:hypothetical protein [Planctomycetota bacterium]HIL51875.1 hypothetical protein [Planctomycetota bacterium]